MAANLKIRSIALVLYENQVLLVAANKLAGAWALPGGTLEPGEEIALAAEREVLEETGVHVRALRLIAYREVWWADRDMTELYFLAELASLSDINIIGGIEQRKIRWQPLGQLDQLKVLPENLAELCVWALSGEQTPLHLGSTDLRTLTDAR